ncbi:MAG: carbonic anhydrase [Bacilli bacterium]|nr:carbonic anhydrase [Bacilli bacterium]
MEELKKGNLEFIKKQEEDKELKKILDTLTTGQHPKAIVVCCSDSRVIPEYIFNKTFGELFVVRTAGNVLNVGELATIEYGVCHLKIKDIIIMGHTGCGAIHATIHEEKGMYVGKILDVIKSNIGDIHDEDEASFINAIKVKESLRKKFCGFELNV